MGPLHDLWSAWVLSHLHGDLPLKSARAELPWSWLYMLRLRGVFSPSKSSNLSSLSEAVIPKPDQMKRLHSHSTNYSDLSLSTKRNKKPTAVAIFSVAMKNYMISARFIQRWTFGMSCLQATWPHLGREEQQATTGVSEEICQPVSQRAGIRIFVTNCHLGLSF